MLSGRDAALCFSKSVLLDEAQHTYRTCWAAQVATNTTGPLVKGTVPNGAGLTSQVTVGRHV